MLAGFGKHSEELQRDNSYLGTVIYARDCESAQLGRLRSLQKKITSQETPASATSQQYYRLLGYKLAAFFPEQILNKLIDEIINSKDIQLVTDTEKAVGLILAVFDLFLRRFQRTVLREEIIVDINQQLGLHLTQRKIQASKAALRKKGFWRNHLREILPLKYDILRKVVFELSLRYTIPVSMTEQGEVRRLLFHQCRAIIDRMEATKFVINSTSMELYSHAIILTALDRLVPLKRAVVKTLLQQQCITLQPVERSKKRLQTLLLRAT